MSSSHETLVKQIAGFILGGAIIESVRNLNCYSYRLDGNSHGQQAYNRNHVDKKSSPFSGDFELGRGSSFRNHHPAKKEYTPTVGYVTTKVTGEVRLFFLKLLTLYEPLSRRRLVRTEKRRNRYEQRMNNPIYGL